MKKIVDYNNGKKIFYECYGSNFNIEREYGKQYKLCNIPIEVEDVWRKDIIQQLVYKIDNTIGAQKIENIEHYLQLITNNDALDFLKKSLKKEMDTFSRIIICEKLKHCAKVIAIKDSALLENINNLLLENVNKMLNEKIVIDCSYFNFQYMQDYDFSDDYIRKRISDILV